MKIKVGIGLALLVVLLQWLVVIQFIDRSYTWWLKASNPVVIAGFATTIMLSGGTIAAVAYALWSHDRFYREASRLRFLSLLIGLSGMAGLLVFFGMVGMGYIILVHR